jgi:hypothetical protein
MVLLIGRKGTLPYIPKDLGTLHRALAVVAVDRALMTHNCNKNLLNDIRHKAAAISFCWR